MAQECANEECMSYMLVLSDEVLVMIFSSLNTTDKISLSKVCRRFDTILLDKSLCRNVIISPESDASCLNHIGIYFRKRRQLIYSLNINSCHWMPTAKLTIMTKNLPNLVSLNVMNIMLSVKNLSKILKESKQLSELSWSWQDDCKSRGIAWSEVPSDERMALGRLKHLHVCLSNPWCLAARELYGFCHDLAYLAVEVDPSFQQLPLPKSNIGENLSGPTKLKSLIAWHSSNTKNRIVNYRVEHYIGLLLKHFWISCGGFLRPWECLWTNAFSRVPWTKNILSPQFDIISTNIKNIVIDAIDFATVHNELPVTQLAINMSVERGDNFPPLITVAPNLRKFAIITNMFSMELNSWVNTAIGSLEFLIEINLFGVHYCGSYHYIERLWLSLQSLKCLKKLAVSPCVLPKIVKDADYQQSDVGTGFVVPQSKVAEVDKALSELLRLNSLEEFEVGNPSNINFHPTSQVLLCTLVAWVPYIAAISVWSQLTSLTIDSIIPLRSLHQFKLVALGCRNLTRLRIRNLGTKGYCGYVKDLATTLSHCQALKHFRLDQLHIFDQIKDLLRSLPCCINLRSIIITNYEDTSHSRLKKKEDFKQALLQVANSCPHLSLMIVTLPDVTSPICNRIKNDILKETSHPRKSALVLEFCSHPKITRTFEDTYHEYLKFPYNSCHYDELHMLSKVALSPPVKHVS